MKNILKRLLQKFLKSRNPLSLRSLETSELINCIAKSIDAHSYLEIGVETGLTFNQVKILQKTGVDPRFQFDYQGDLRTNLSFHEITSDEFFKKLAKNEIKYQKFDLVFIDGLHVFEQVVKDFMNVINHMNLGGVIVIDDTVPIDEFSVLPSQKDCYRLRIESGRHNDGSWHGDVYKLIYVLSKNDKNKIRIATVTDLSNPKTVVWKEDGDWSRFEIGSRLVDKTFYELFENGIPRSFMPMNKKEFLEFFKMNSTAIN